LTEFYVSAFQYGNKILYRGYKNGRRVHEKVDFSPTLYLNAKKSSKYKTLFGQMVEPIQPGSINDCKDFIKRYDGVDGFDVYGMTQYNYQYIADKFPGEIIPDMSVMNITTIDLECASELGFPDPVKADEEILLISIHEKNTNKNIVWGTRDYIRLPEDTFEYRLCSNEQSMIRQFIEWWQGNTPDILTGWNINGFDIPYLVNRITKILDEDWLKKLSPWGVINSREFKSAIGKSVVEYAFLGVVFLDYLELYRKYTYSSQESYALGNIATVELGTAKKELDGSFRDAYNGTYEVTDPNIRTSSKFHELSYQRHLIKQEIIKRGLKVTN
jgi:DNA polymerase elongation subunit (family B)